MNPADKIKKYRDSIDKETVKQKVIQNRYAVALSVIVAGALLLRYLPEQGMKYLQAADPYMIYRMSQHLALEGNLPRLDFLRYFPYAMPTYLAYNGDFVIPALLYQSGFSLIFPTFLEFAQFYPAMMGAGSVLITYFLGKELYNRNTGLAAAFFLALTSAAFRRTSAGFFEKEPIGTFLMMTSLLFFTRAWKRTSWKNGILSGISLALFTVSWGGSQILWLLYPIITGITLFLNEDIRSLIAAYTPTVLLGGIPAAILLHRRFSLTSSLFLFSTAVLGALWLRYLVEEFDLMEESQLGYLIPSLSVLGGVMALLSPLYSDFIARKVVKVVRKMMGAKGGVIAGTVAENAPPPVSSVASSLASPLVNIGGLGGGIAALFSPWGLMLFGTVFMIAPLLLMLGKKYKLIEGEVAGKRYAAYIQSVFIAWMVFVSGLLVNMVMISLVAAAGIGASLIAVAYFLDEESVFSITSLAVIGAAAAAFAFTFKFSGGLYSSLSYLVLLPSIAAVIGTAVIYYTESFETIKIEPEWYKIIPVVWVVASLFGGMTRSRLLFLSSFAVAFAAGHGLSTVLRKLKGLEYRKMAEKLDTIGNDNLEVDSRTLMKGCVGAVIVLVLSINLASGYITSQGIRGSPNTRIWGQSLDFMQDTPNGSVVLSWWDYGYHFQTLGRAPSVADGGQGGYYTRETRAVNMPLADYLNSTASNPKDRVFLRKHSVDYIWLDHSMIGKFSAVSQISNKDNREFTAMQQVGTRGTFRQALSRNGNESVVELAGRLGRNRVRIFAPVEITNRSIDLKGSPTVRFANGAELGIGCVLTDEGRQTYNVEGRELNYCIAEDPFYSFERGAAGGSSRIVLVPKKISNSTIVRLYLQDGWGVSYAEKIPEASNGYIKMWKVEQ